MAKITSDSRCTARPGDLGVFDDGDGVVVGVVIEVGFQQILVGWGDCTRWCNSEEIAVGPRQMYHPSAGAMIGKKFTSIEDARSESTEHLK